MAKLIYAVLALAAASLVAGFVVRTSSIPLLVSIGLSALIAVLILAGWSRRLRAGGFLDAEPEVEELEAVEPEPVPALVSSGAADATEVVRPRARPARRPRRDEPAAALEDTTIGPPAPPKAPARRPSRKATSAKARAARTRPLTDAVEVVRPRKQPPRRKFVERKFVERKPVERKPVERKPVERKPKPSPKAKRARRVAVIPGRSKYHRPDCRFAKGDDVREVTEAAARKRGYVPCSVCKP